MAIPGIPSQFYIQQGNRQVLASWSITAAATSYDLQRSTDGVTFASIATPTEIQYLDTSVTVGVQYYYKVAAVSVAGTSPYTTPQSIIPTPSAEMSLAGIRLAAQQRADQVGSNFVTLPEWNFFINEAMFELYDLLVTAYEDYFMATPVHFVSQGNQASFDLPNGLLTFLDDNNNSIVAKPFYKLLGVDLGLNTANNAYVTLNKYNLIDRNRYVYPNTTSTIYGWCNLQYRVLGSKIDFIPTPSASQSIRLLYIPRLDQLLSDTDITTIGFSGWLQYVIIRAAKYVLDKQESDTSKLDAELLFLKTRIEESSQNRDAGQPDRISDMRQNGSWGSGSGGWGSSGPIGGM